MQCVSISRVTERICDMFFHVRGKLEEAQSDEKTIRCSAAWTECSEGADSRAAMDSMEEVPLLSSRRDLLVALWPFGRTVDHYSPECLKQEVFESDMFRKRIIRIYGH